MELPYQAADPILLLEPGPNHRDRMMALGARGGKTRPEAGADSPQHSAVNSIQRSSALVSGGITVGSGTTIGAVTVFPLSHGLPPGDHLLCPDADARGLVTIEETSWAGTVGELRVTNGGSGPVLLLEGEVRLGLKQTRVPNTSVLVPGRTVITVPVSCVEVGRWHHVSRAALGRDVLNLSPRVRHATASSVLRSARAAGRCVSNQAAVWQGVEAALADHGVRTRTGSYADVARERGGEILGRIRGLRPGAGQAGVLAYVGAELRCLDLFDGPATLAAVWESLIGSYVGDAEAEVARTPSRGARPASRAGATRWLRSLAAGQIAVAPPLGLGDHLTCLGSGSEGTALLPDGTLVHLAAFPAPR